MYLCPSGHLQALLPLGIKGGLQVHLGLFGVMLVESSKHFVHEPTYSSPGGAV